MRSMTVVSFASLAMVVGSLVPVGAVGEEPVSVDVRVVTFKGRVLADRSVLTGTTTVRTSRKATCLGGEPTADRKVVEGPTALGALAGLSGRLPRLDPLLLSGAFDFGIGVCGVGRFVASGTQWWALKVNGSLASAGGDSTVVENGDQVLWYLDRSYARPFPDELRMKVLGDPAGPALRVRVLALDGSGKARPAPGARIVAAGRTLAVTGGRGRAEFTLDTEGTGPEFAVARLAGHIPSNRVEVGDGS